MYFCFKLYQVILSILQHSHFSRSSLSHPLPTLAGARLSGSFRPELLLVRHGGVPTPECSDDGVVPGIEKLTHVEWTLLVLLVLTDVLFLRWQLKLLTSPVAPVVLEKNPTDRN